ncbi:PucR family transcriptional regulator [Desmospora profundinema]|uniref:Purine catabolism regulator n=1 Tax=Desmospora profundinema TaxID=1571184 RepID=A0ABU1IJU4_9BACL|nr:PucR family transcriptional regulator ligand-binding domain-containing protein [Desmospora profundinema]MDR6224095.1 purine catabolism regulator [Desmospora profundinema]
MPLTVRDVLQLDIMHGAIIRTSGEHSLQNPVESISVMEVPVENFVRRNEWVLSTAVGCGHDPVHFRNFVQALIDSDAACLALATGRHIRKIPDDVIQLADRQNMPLIEIPWQTRFADIMQIVLRELDHRQDDMAFFSQETQKELLQMILQGSNLTKLASVIQRKMGYPVLFVDRKGEIKGSSPAAQRLLRFWREQMREIHRSIAHPYRIQSAFHNYSQGEWKRVELPENTLIEIPIWSARKQQGSLFLLLPKVADGEEPLNREEQIYLDHAATASAFCFLQENVAVETETRLKSDFVWSLAKGEITTEETIETRGKALGYDTSCPYVCILGEAEQKIGQEERTGSPPLPEMMDEVVYAGKAVHRQIMTSRQPDQLVIYLEVPMDRVVDTVQSFLDILEGRLHEQFPEFVVSWGIGEKRAGVHTFRASYQDARAALNIGRRHKGSGYRNFHFDTGLYRALEHLSEHPDMREITWSAMSRLLDYSQLRGIDLIETFTSYLRNHCNVSQTARELNLHRQSLLYRLRKIESLTGRSLMNPDDLFLLQLSIKLWSGKK